MANTTNGLTNDGITAHYSFQYDDALDSTLHPGQPEPARTNTVMAACENDFNIMKAWFGNIELSYPYPISIIVANAGGGASWGPPITLKGGNGDANFLRDLMVAEVTEMFMLAQNKGWFASDGSNEQSSGEGLSHFLNQQFEIIDGRNPGLAFNSDLWLNSSLPTSDPACSRFGGGATPYDYGSRYDYVNNILEYDHSNSPASGCSVMFIWYLFKQLGFTVAQICQAAAPTLGGVYRNLIGDTGDPFPFFKQLMGIAYPENTVSNIPGTNPDNPFPLAMLSFWVDKNTFGKDEVQDILNTHAGRFNNAFWLVVEGFNINIFNSLGVTIPNFTGTFANILGISIVRSATPIDFENPSKPAVPQRIRIAYDIIFNNASLASFPNVGDGPIVRELDARVTIGGTTPSNATAATVFELTAGADPYFTNIDPTQNNAFWLSQDLRVFKATPALNNVPVAGGPVFGNDNVNGAFTYIQNLLIHLNTNFSDPSGTDPFVSLLPGQSGALSGDSSVSPLTIDISDIFNIHLYNNYNFAIARVRLRALPGNVAKNIKVFFRLWSTQTADTDFQPNDTYRSTQNGGHPSAPLVGNGNHTIPFFATGNFSANNDYAVGGINNKNITLDIGDTKWAYFGCFLNLYDSGNIVNGQPIQTVLNGTHHCIVAEIASDDAPILNSAAVTLSPENSDKLAQRNLQFTASDNPGDAPSHRIPQTFDTRPSKSLIQLAGSLLNYPDELMIDWGNTPIDSLASIYWPQVNANDVLHLASALYANFELSASDANTIQCKVTKGVSYVPIPIGSGENFAGLITVELPTTVVNGEEFNIIVRRITSRRSRESVPVLRGPNIYEADEVELRKRGRINNPNDLPENMEIVNPKGDRYKLKNWRYVTGTFQIKIQVGTPTTLLNPEMNTLAIFKWRLQQMSPSNRWYPVLQRYITFVSGRVNSLGGDADKIKPSPLGYWQRVPTQNHSKEHKGKVSQVIYNCDGEFEGFVLSECCDKKQSFSACDKGIEEIILRAFKERYQISIFTSENGSGIAKILFEG